MKIIRFATNMAKFYSEETTCYTLVPNLKKLWRIIEYNSNSNKLCAIK